MKNSNDSLLIEIGELLVRVMDNALSKEEFDRLQTLLKDNPSARGCYYDILATFAGMDEIEVPSMYKGTLDMAAWKAMADIERTAPAVIIEKNKRKPEAVLQVEKTETIVRKVNKVSLMVAVTSLAALLLMILFVNFLPFFEREEVATVTDSVNAQWAKSDISAGTDARLAVRQGVLTLEKGAVKLRFDTNAKVVIEAPAKFEITTGDQIRLLSGRAYATIPPEAVGFSIKTFNSIIVDLGTEFGVQVDQGGNTELHVLKGKTTLISGSRDRISAMLTEGVAKKISGPEAQLSDLQCDGGRFVREISSQNHILWRGESIQLADMAGGGNGFGTGTSNVGIDPLTGLTSDIKELDRNASNDYVALPKNKNPFVDGIFVPNGKSKQIVSSQGHRFEECPVTCGNFFTEIGNTPQIVLLNPSAAGKNGSNTAPFSLLMHANLGITFDLDAIRSQLSGRKIKQFKSTLCISQTAPGQPNADFWILVDGKVRYSKKNVTQKDFFEQVTIDLQKNDQYLTLVTTDGQDPEIRVFPDGFIARSIYSDWCVFSEPKLVLE
jgi:hypothetical protein